MKHFFSIKHTLYKVYALTAAAVLSLAAVGAYSPITASAEGETPDDSQSEGNEKVELQLSDKPFYRWEKLTDDNYKEKIEQGKEYPVLIIGMNSHTKKTSGNFFLNGVAPECLWFGCNVSLNKYPADSLLIGNRKDEDFIDDKIYEQDNEEHDQFYVHSKYTVNADAKQIDITKDVFFTDSDFDTPFISLSDTNRYGRKNKNGTASSTYIIRLKSSNSHQYYIWGNDDADGYLDITVDKLPPKDSEGDQSAWTFQTLSSNDKWSIFQQEYHGHDDECLEYQKDYGLFYIEDGDHDGDEFKVYIGEEYHFRQISVDTKVSKNTITPVTSGEYIADGQTMHSEGTLIPQGKTLTVEPGGILSVEGTLINNGTIINQGTILVKNGGTITPFLPDGTPKTDGCGAIKMLGGDMIIQEGGTVYGGIGNGTVEGITEFVLEEGSTLINQGVLVYGGLELGIAARLEMYPGSRTYGGYFIHPYKCLAEQKTTYPKEDFINFDKLKQKKAAEAAKEQTVYYLMKQDIYSGLASGMDEFSLYLVTAEESENGKYPQKYNMTDMLQKENTIWAGGKNASSILKPVKTDNLKSNNLPWDYNVVDRLPFGLYLGDHVVNDVDKPIVKLDKNAFFEDSFVKNISVMEVELTI